MILLIYHLLRIIRQQGYSWTGFKVDEARDNVTRQHDRVHGGLPHSSTQKLTGKQKAPWVMMHDQLVGLRTGL